MIDLHSHTNEYDGTCSPAELIDEAVRAGVSTLGITDHDTFKGYDQAVAPAAAAGVELICGIELSTKLQGHSAHLLGYFLANDGLSEPALGTSAVRSAFVEPGRLTVIV